jgi:DinB superfamily
MATAKDVIRLTLDGSDMFLKSYLSDLDDDALKAVPVPGMNPIAWQLGHMLSSHREMLEQISPGSAPELPAGFAAAHSKETATPNAFTPVATKAEYLSAWDAQRAATLSLLDALPDASLDAETGVPYAPTVAALFNVIGVHVMGHAGQFVAVRRALGKPVVI